MDVTRPILEASASGRAIWIVRCQQVHAGDDERVGGNLCGDTLYHASLDTSEYRERLEGLGYEVRQLVVEGWHNSTASAGTILVDT